MINKQSLWFVTLFSLIIILGIYYIQAPSDSLTVFSNADDNKDNSEVINVTESDIIVALKVEEEEKILSQMDEAKQILLDNTKSTDEKNEAYETLQLLNSKKGKVSKIEKILKEKFNIDSCVTINDNKVNITTSSVDKGNEFANEIISEVQKLYEEQMYITVKFE